MTEAYSPEEISSMEASSKVHAAKRAERTERLCKMLTLYVGFTYRGRLGEDAVMEYNPKGKGYAGDLFIVCDNGGEWNIIKINHAWDGQSVAYTAWGFELNTCDQAQRVVQYINGEPINYDAREDAEFCESMFEMAKLPALPSWHRAGAEA
jgi:hypothetical protein